MIQRYESARRTSIECATTGAAKFVVTRLNVPAVRVVRSHLRAGQQRATPAIDWISSNVGRISGFWVRDRGPLSSA